MGCGVADNQLTTATGSCAIGCNESARYDDDDGNGAEVVKGRGFDGSCDLLTMQGFQSSMASDDLPASCKALSWEAGKQRAKYGQGRP